MFLKLKLRNKSNPGQNIDSRVGVLSFKLHLQIISNSGKIIHLICQKYSTPLLISYIQEKYFLYRIHNKSIKYFQAGATPIKSIIANIQLKSMHDSKYLAILNEA
jgi:hypothetical protein